MGSSTYSVDDWKKYSSRKGIDKATTATHIYTSTRMKDYLDPKNIKVRESCDSDTFPVTTPIIIGLDVSGSMGDVLMGTSKRLNDLITQIIDRKPVPGPQLMFMGIGDAEAGDDAPLQVTQFETDIKIAEQLNDIWFEQGGGGNDHESYNLPWYFAANYTKTDSYLKRNEKGFLFTMGDESVPYPLTKSMVNSVFGTKPQFDQKTNEELIAEVSKMYNVYHLIIEEGNFMRSAGRRADEAKEEWKDLLGQNAIFVSDINAIPEIIVSILEVNAGKDTKDVIASWDGSKAIAVKKAIGDLTETKKSTDLVEF